jgi:hypothetical protein
MGGDRGMARYVVHDYDDHDDDHDNDDDNGVFLSLCMVACTGIIECFTLLYDRYTCVFN